MSDQATKQPSERISVAYAGREHDVQESVDVLMINSRGIAHPWTIAAIDSVKAQHYPETMLLVLDNTDHALSIGAAYNALVKQSSAAFVQFLSDDDAFTVDLVGSSLACLLSARKRSASIVHATTSTTVIIEPEGHTAHASNLLQLGMFEREFLLTNRFNEALSKGIDRDMHSRLDSLAKFRRAPLSVPITHQSGYLFRQHIGMAGGMRVQIEPKSPLSIHK